MLDKTYDLTNPQKSIWFTEQFYKGTSIENITGSVIISQTVNFNALKQAINLFVQKNDSFRLKFSIIKDKPVQYVENFSSFDIETISISTKKEIELIEKELSNTPFDILNSLLFAFKLFKLPNNNGGFVICAHHLISDAWTAGLVVNQIMGYYTQIINSETIQKDNNTSYIEYISSEQEYLKSDKFEKDKTFWNNIFSSIPEVATIPCVNSNVEVTSELSCSAKRKQFIIPKETMELINSFCKENKASAFNFFMGVFSIYISRVSNLDDFVIGTPILNRSNFKEKQTTGMYISTVPFRIAVNNENSFADFISKMATDFSGIFRHQKYPYQYLLEDLRKTDSTIPSLYNIMLSYQNVRSNKQSSEVSYESRWVANSNISDDIDIHLYDMNDTGSINIAYDYLINKYSVDDICSIHARILHIINQILKNPEITLKDIEIVTPDEKNKILYEFNNTKIDYPKDKTISQLFEEQVEKTPDNIAVVFEDQKLTYKELNEKANSLANYLREKGIGRNDIVGIMVNRSLEMIIGIMAILKSGGCYVPVDPEYPQDRIEYMLQNSEAKILLTFENQKDKVEFDNKVFIELSSNIYNEKTTNLKNINIPEDLAYIIYTSGSTGLPKGVMLKHSNINNFIKGTADVIDFDKTKTIVSVTTISFDIFVLETLLPLQKGLKIVIANENEQTNVKLFNELCVKNKVNIIQTTPSRFQALISDKNELTYMKNITDILVGGEPFPPILLENLQQLSKANIFNMYGPTETAVWSTIKDLTNEKEITIGTPIANTFCCILDKNKNLLPPLIPGNLYIGGDGVSKGYFKNEDLTSEKFISNPYIDNETIYNTGDLAYFNRLGELIHLGRTDFQVKIRGYRIELGEIERNISHFKNVTSCVVIALNLKNSENCLISYYTSKENINIKSLRKYLQEKLPTYMIPQYFIELDKLPYTPNGKIDRKKLPMPKESLNKEIVLPRNDIDSKLIDVLKDLLSISSISIEDSFFELGGDSLSAINLSTKIYNKFNIEIFVKDILENPVIKDLSDLISSKNEVENINVIKKAKKAEYYPASAAQKRIYYASLIDGETSMLYNLTGGLLLDKLPDIKKLETCFNSLIQRHESLRTSFDIVNNEVVQKVQDIVEYKLDVEEGLLKDKQKLFYSFSQPFNLSQASLFRTKLIKFEDSSAMLLVDMHHIISDGTSLSILINELCSLYNDELLPSLRISYKDFSVWEKEELESEKLQEAKQYWLNRFGGEIPVLNMPSNYSRPAVQSFEGRKVYGTIDSKLNKQIDDISKQLGITPYMLLLSVYYILLSKYTGQEDIVVGSPIVGRDLSEISNVIGMFVNTLALRNTVDSKTSFRDFLNLIRETCLESYKYQTYPFDELVNNLNVKRDTSRNPLFDTMFIYQNNGNAEVVLNGINAKYYIPDSKISKFDLSLEIIPTKETLDFSFEYCTKLFDKDFIERLSTHYINILKAVLENIDVEIGNICMLSDDEKNKILYEFNDTKADYPKDKTISQLFEEQVEKTPDNIAVVFEDQKLTYKELNEKANSLANYLREKGIGRNDIVGIMVNRSLEMIIGIMAVLKSGGCYIPIDPEYPQDRIEYMLQNSGAKFVLSKHYLNDNISFDNIINIDLNNINIYNLPNSNLKNINKPDDTSYIIYTSGSTGLPKGVSLKHKSITNLAYYLNNYVTFLSSASTSKIIASVTTVSFDIFIFETLICLQRGLEIVLANEEEQHIPSKLSELIEKNNVRIIQMTPSRMQIFLDNIEDCPSISKLNHVVLAGEPLPDKLLSDLIKLGIKKVYNGYGPSETTVFSTFTDVTNYIKINIGKPLSNTQTYILDKNMNPTPIGIPGELYISGDGVGLGYINNPNLTNKTFINNPFVKNTLMYKTGDFCKFLNNGEISYLERIDNQIKIRGLRIELDEIETKILEYPNILKAKVVKQNISNREFISAYFVASKRIKISVLRKYLSNSLPSYMIPSYFTALDEFEYTPNGKIDKKSLPIPTDILSINKEKYVAPKTDLEIKLVSIWEKILNTKPIGINDNFFELGGDSVLAMNLNIELLKISKNIQYADIFNFPTISDLIKKMNSDEKEISYSNIEEISAKYLSVLEKNITNISKIKYVEPKNILLTGITGFLGAHILDSFIKNEKGNVYCIIRNEPGITAQTKLYQKLNYYFGNKYDKLIGQRIFAITGDITNTGFGLNQEDLLSLANSVDIVINSAAKVDHYGSYNDFYNVNTKSVKNIIDFCSSFNKKFYQISTLSVSGNSFDSSSIKQNFENQVYFRENNLYIGQSLENVYTRSKFEAECYVLDAINNGLDAYILRMGNLMPRLKDGVFQENILDNAYINRIAAFIRIGCIPEYMKDVYLEFTPIDVAANAVIKIITHPSENNRIFHLFNHNHVYLKQYFNLFEKSDCLIKIVSEEEFIKNLKLFLNNKKKKDSLNILVNDFDNDLHLLYNTDITIKSEFTINYLNKIGFKWPNISKKYLLDFIQLLKKVI